MASRVGSQYSFNSAANSGSQSVDIPSCELMVVVTIGFCASGSTMNGGSLSIGGNALSVAHYKISDEEICIWYRVSPPTGSQSLAWDWTSTGNLSASGVFLCSYYNGINTSSLVKDTADAIQGWGTTVATGTMTAAANDLVICGVADYTVTNTSTWSSGTELYDAGYNNESAHIVEAFPTGDVSITCTVSDSSWLVLAAVVFTGEAEASGNPWYYYAQQLRSLKDKWRGLLQIPSLEEVKLYGRLNHA